MIDGKSNQFDPRARPIRLAAGPSARRAPNRCESQSPSFGIPHSAFRIPNAFSLQTPDSNLARPSAFTLVELMVVISIMAVLASLVLFAMAGATESAKAAKTKSTINKLNAVIMAKYESYRTRRLPVDIKAVATAKGYTHGSNNTPTTLDVAQARLDVIRDLMRMEMPDGFQDVSDGPLTSSTVGSVTQTMTRPAASARYLAVLNAAQTKNSAAVAATNLQQAMCLYWIVTLGSDDSNVLEQFSSDEIALDADTGLHYFVDGWGHAIYFLRWAPGFSSPLQPWDLKATTKNFPPGHDPFDPLHTHIPKFPSQDPFYDPNKSMNEQTYPPLFPLVYSPGPDGGYEIEVESGTRYGSPAVNNDPYYTAEHQSTSNPPVGAWNDANGDGVDNRVDNITNHDIGEN